MKTDKEVASAATRVILETLRREFKEEHHFKDLISQGRLESAVYVFVHQAPKEMIWYIDVELVAPPKYRSQFYDLLAEVENRMQEEEGIDCVLSAWPEEGFEYEVDGETILVTQRNFSRWLYVTPKRSHGGPHYSALYAPDGDRVSLGTVQGGFGKIEPPPEQWIQRFDKAKELHLERLKKRKKTA